MAQASEQKTPVVALQSGDTNRSVPHSQEAERALLGALLLNNALYGDIEGLLSPEHFYVGVHGRVYEALARIVDRDQVADPISLSNYFGSADWFQEIGGKSFLEELNENATTIINVRTYADIIYSHFLSRQLIDIGSELVTNAFDIDPEEGPLPLLDQTESRLFKLAEQGQSGASFQGLKKPLVQVVERIEKAKASNSFMTGVTTGLKDVDKVLGGLQRSDLIILAARPSMGKTSLALNIALNAAQALGDKLPTGAGVAVFSLEMSTEQLTSRLLSSSARVSTEKMARGEVSHDEFQRIVASSDELSRLRVFIDDTPQLPINQLRTRVRRLKRQEPSLGLIVVDYLQLLRGSTRANESRVQEISEISQGLKAIAREIDVPVIALSQLSRAVESRENKRPQLSDLRESGSIEQDADIVMFLYREAYYREREFGADPTPDQLAQLDEIRNLAELLISKNRKGSTGQIKLTFDGPTTTFRDFTPATY